MKKYFIRSAIAAWAMILLIAVISALIHQIKFQDSSHQIHMQTSIENLKADLDFVESVNKYYLETIKELMNDSIY